MMAKSRALGADQHPIMKGVVRVLMTLALVLLTSVGAAAQTPPAERPTYTLGDKWILSDGVYELTRIENDVYIFAAAPGQEIHLTRNLGVAKIVRNGAAVWEFEAPADLPWPLRIGQWGTSRGAIRQNGRAILLVNTGASMDAILTGTVDAFEDVTVAGTPVRAFRVTTRIIPWGPSASDMGSIAVWYAPEARRIVRIVSAGRFTDLGLETVVLDGTASRPLEIVLEEPRDQAKVSSDRLNVVAKALSGPGVTRMTIEVNGAVVGRQEETKAPKPELTVKTRAMLHEGRNTILVTAVDARGEMRQEARIVFFDKPGGSPAPSPVADEARRRAEAERLVAAERQAERDAAERRAALEAQRRAEQEAARRARDAEAQRRAESERLALVEARRNAEQEAAELRAKVAAATAVVPLKIAISSPADKARVEQPTIGLAAIASAGKGVQRVVLTVNGAEVKRFDGPPASALPLNLPLTLREGSNTVVVTAVDGAGAVEQEVRTVHYDPVLPFTLAVKYPTDGLTVLQPTTVIVAEAASSKGVSVTVTVNGKEPGQSRDVSAAAAPVMPQRAVALTTPITLNEGSNIIVVTATETNGTSRQEVRTVTYAKPADAASTGALAGKPQPDRWAVIIGIGEYEHPGIGKLRYTVNDADALYRLLTGPGGFKKEHVLLLTDKTERPPTLKNIKWALGTFLARSAKNEDTVVIFFAGHGAPEVDKRGVERDGVAKYLIPRDADADDLYSSALPMDELRTIFERIDAERIVMFVDACYSGATGGRTFLAKSTRAMNIDDEFLQRAAGSKGRAIVTASRANEVSIELPDLKHGIFTHYLVEGLKGAADGNRDGIVSLQELYEYVERQVSAKARAVGGNQHPVMKGELEGTLPLVRLKK